jgi:O-antigen/teichoic acid export membrane protein
VPLEDSLNRPSVKANFIFNAIGMSVPVAVAFVTIPIYVAHIGLARYGVLSIVWVLLGYFGFLDFGLSRASANALAKLVHASQQERTVVLVTSLYLNLFLGLVGGVALYLAGGAILAHFWSLSNDMTSEVGSSMVWIACLLPLALVSGVARGAIESREHFFSVNALDLIGTVLGQILPLLAAILIAPSLTIIIPAALLARATSVVAILVFVARSEKVRSLYVFDRARVPELLGFGAWVSVSSAIGPILTSIDQLLIGSKLGVVAVTHYAIPISIVGRSQLVASALARALYPRFSRLHRDEARALAERAITSLGYMFGALCGPAIIFGSPFLKLWMGADFATHATAVFEILLLGAWINGVAFIPYSYLEGQGRPDLVAKLHALEFLPFIAVIWLLLTTYGLVGAALASSGRVAVDAILLFVAARISMKSLMRLLPAAIMLLVSYFAATFAVSILVSAVLAVVSFLAFAVAAVVFDESIRTIFLDWYRRLLGSEPVDVAD